MANSAMAKKPFSTNSAKTTMISRINIFRGSPPLAVGPHGRIAREPGWVAADQRRHEYQESYMLGIARS